MSSYHGNDYTVELERDLIPVSSLYPEPDPDWTFVDSRGHRHDASRATLEWVVRTYWCEDCRDEHEEGEWRCRVCGEAVSPGTRMARDREISGLLKGTLTADWGAEGCVGTWYLRGDELTISAGDIDKWQARIRASREPDDLRLVLRGRRS